MRVTNLVLPVTVSLAIMGAFAAGYYVGESAGRERGADMLFNLDATRSAEGFMLAASVRQALHESKPEKADAAVVRYSALKAPSLAACRASPDCAASVGRLMPTKAQLEEALAADRRLLAR